MSFFRSEREVLEWCERTGYQPGEILTLEQIWQLSQLWYSNRLKPDYRGRQMAEIQAIFQQVGLQTPFWQP